MTPKQKFDIEQISKQFVRGIGIELSGSGWLIVDPLSGYLNFCGYKNTVYQIPATETASQILIIKFDDGTQFAPAGSDFKYRGFSDAHDYLWID